MDLDLTKPITGLAEDRIEHVTLCGASDANSGSIELAFDTDNGKIIVDLPRERLELALGEDLANWLLTKLPAVVHQGEHIEAQALLAIETLPKAYEKDGARFAALRWIFIDANDKAVFLSVPRPLMDRDLGELLTHRLATRGTFLNRAMLQFLNADREKMLAQQQGNK